jgi:SSS family transporter
VDPSREVLSFHWLDGLIIGLYLLVLAGIGYYHSRQQKNLKEFFLAGKSVAWIPMGISLMAALNSGLDYLMQPSGVLKFGIALLVTNLTWLLLYPYVFYITLPLYRRLDVYSAYEYLERRFSVAVRGLAAGIFLLWRMGWMATALYVPCLAITSATGNQEYIVPTIVVLGSLVTFYTMMGGIRAVIWTDVTQFFIMFGGLAITIAVILANTEGGFSAILANALVVGDPEIAALRKESTGLLNYFFIPMPMLGLLIAGMVSRVTNYTSDQVMVQRFQTTRTLKESRRGFIITALGDIVWMTVLIFVGVALFTYFEQQGGMPAWLKEEEDQLFPYFMGAVFPVGLTGLVIAAIFAASLSSIDSAINSMTSVLTVDFYQRIYLGHTRKEMELSPEEDRRQIRISRMATIAIGIVGITLACNVSRLGTILEISNKIINGFSGPVLGIFILGMFTKRVSSKSVILGGVIGTLLSIYTIFWSSPDLVQEQGLEGFFPARAISFIWPSVFGFLSCFSIGYLSSFILPGGAEEKSRAQEWNWFSVTRNSAVD